MARTKKEPPKDPRVPKDFEEVTSLSYRLADARQKFALAHTPPPGFTIPHGDGASSGREWNGRHFDSLFGLEPLCAIAALMWQARDAAVAATKTPLVEASVLGTGAITVADAPDRHNYYRIPARPGESSLVLYTAMPSYYPTESALGPHAIVYHTGLIGGHLRGQRHADFRRLTAAQRADVQALRVWAQEAMRNRAQALEAIRFLDVVMSHASQMADVVQVLPGLDGIFQALNLQHLKESFEPKPRSKPFDMMRLRMDRPRWASEWSEFRTTLLAMAMAVKHDWRVYSGTVVAYHTNHPVYPTDE
jgi:hypothetical protein